MESAYRGFLDKAAILALQERMQKEPAGPLIGDADDDTLFKEWSYDLRLGGEAFLSGENKLQRKEDGGIVTISPGEFALLITKEKLRMPDDHVAFISLKFTYALKGLINVSGFHVDPCYKGHLLFSVYNAGPNAVVVRMGDPMFMIIFAPLHGRVTPAEGKTFPEIKRLEASMINQVRGPPVSLASVETRVSRLEDRIATLVALLAATIAGLLALAVTR